MDKFYDRFPLQNREDLGREKFVEKIWEWKNEKGDKIFKQLRTMGASLDWTNSKFTMSEVKIFLKCFLAI